VNKDFQRYKKTRVNENLLLINTTTNITITTIIIKIITFSSGRWARK